MTDVAAVGLSKSYGTIKAVDDVSFMVTGGRVCALAGPNGAGKSTLIGMLLGLIRPQSGSATFDGCAYAALDRPAETVGAVIDAAGVHPDRTAREHLRVLATAARLPFSRVEEVLAETELAGVAERPVRTFSLGMRATTATACAQLADRPLFVLRRGAPRPGAASDALLRDMLTELRATGWNRRLSRPHDLGEAELLADDVDASCGRARIVAQGAGDAS